MRPLRLAALAVFTAVAWAAPAQAGTITVYQDTQPNSSQVFSYLAGGGLSPTSFQLDDDGFSQNAFSNSRAFTANAGTYSVVQDTPTPAGYDPPQAYCSDGSSPSSVNLGLTEDVYCVFSNGLSTAGTLTVVKDTQPDGPQSFSFEVSGPTSPGRVRFSLQDDGSGPENTASFIVNPGSGYRAQETVPGGWALQSATCSDGSDPMSITISPDEHVTCTFVNFKPAVIRVIKDAQPNDPQDFSFTTGGGLNPSTFSLDDDSDPALPRQIDFNVVPGSGYSVTEAVPAGWHQTSATCSDGSPVSNIDLGSGELVVCTFSNEADDAGTLTVRKDAQPDRSRAFTFTSNGEVPTFNLVDDGAGPLAGEITFKTRPGTYFVNENVPGGWDLTSATCSDGSPVSAIEMSAGENVVCTFVNTEEGSITVVKDAQPDSPQHFTFTRSGSWTGGFLLDDHPGDETLPNLQTFSVSPGSGYSVSESPVPYWTQVSATCNDGSPVSNISVSAGEAVVCTFVNTHSPNLIVKQDTQPDDPRDFTFSGAGSGLPTSFQLDDDGSDSNDLSSTAAFYDLEPGTYSIASDGVFGYDLVDASCSDGSKPSSVSVAAGKTVTCTFANLTPDAARITVVKDAQPQAVTPFNFTVTGGTIPSAFALDDDGNEANSRPSSRTVFVPNPGSGFSISESLPPGWDQTSATCSDGSPVTNVNVFPEERVTCTFANTRVTDYPGYPRPKAATPFHTSLVIAYAPCELPNRVHAAPLNHTSCSPPGQTSATVSAGSPDANNAAANMTGFLRMVVTGSGASADVALTVNATDVRCRAETPNSFPCGPANAAAGRDYAGELRIRGTIRATDKLNGVGTGGPAGTVTDIDWGPDVPCASTVSTAIGATCALTTTFNTLIPGSVQGSFRSIWEHGQISIYDGGPDGDGDTTGDNSPFLRQGIFVP